MQKKVKILSLALGVMAFGAASADVSTMQGSGSNDTAACTAAKQSGQSMISNMNMKSIQARYEISGYGDCQCEPPLSSGTRWCAVDMYYRRIQ
jgi:hypothetical protein